MKKNVGKLTLRTNLLTSSRTVDSKPSIGTSFNTISRGTVCISFLWTIINASTSKVISIVIRIAWTLRNTSSWWIISPSHRFCRALNHTFPCRIISIRIWRKRAFIQNTCSRLIISPTIWWAIIRTNSCV